MCAVDHRPPIAPRVTLPPTGSMRPPTTRLRSLSNATRSSAHFAARSIATTCTQIPVLSRARHALPTWQRLTRNSPAPLRPPRATGGWSRWRRAEVPCARASRSRGLRPCRHVAARESARDCGHWRRHVASGSSTMGFRGYRSGRWPRTEAGAGHDLVAPRRGCLLGGRGTRGAVMASDASMRAW